MTMISVDIHKINYDIMKAVDDVLKKHNIEGINLDKNVKDMTVCIGANDIPCVNITYQCIPDEQVN